MNWMDKNIRNQILFGLRDSYGDSLPIQELLRKIPTNAIPSDLPIEVFLQNIRYLHDNGLVVATNLVPRCPQYVQVAITSKGIDYLEPDGGLSASLGVITVKLHSDTIQQLLAAKIDQSDMPEAEKSELKTALATIKSAALTTITEEAIRSAPWAALLAVLKQALL